MCTILVKFTDYNTRRVVYQKRSLLKENAPGVFINEDLTLNRRRCLGVLHFLRKKGVIYSTWSHDGRILYRKTEKGKEVQVYSIQDIQSKFPGTGLPSWV
jgi:hypothetical protein